MTSTPRPLLLSLAPVGTNDATGAPPAEKSNVWMGPPPEFALFPTIIGPEAIAGEAKTSQADVVSNVNKPNRSERYESERPNEGIRAFILPPSVGSPEPPRGLRVNRRRKPARRPLAWSRPVPSPASPR